jgi:hypothetical protein
MLIASVPWWAVKPRNYFSNAIEKLKDGKKAFFQNIAFFTLEFETHQNNVVQALTGNSIKCYLFWYFAFQLPRFSCQFLCGILEVLKRLYLKLENSNYKCDKCQPHRGLCWCTRRKGQFEFRKFNFKSLSEMLLLFFSMPVYFQSVNRSFSINFNYVRDM